MDLIILITRDLDVIVGMDWMSQHGAVIDCVANTVTFSGNDGELVVIATTISNSIAESYLTYLDDET